MFAAARWCSGYWMGMRNWRAELEFQNLLHIHLFLSFLTNSPQARRQKKKKNKTQGNTGG